MKLLHLKHSEQICVYRLHYSLTGIEMFLMYIKWFWALTYFLARVNGRTTCFSVSAFILLSWLHRPFLCQACYFIIFIAPFYRRGIRKRMPVMYGPGADQVVSESLPICMDNKTHMSCRDASECRSLCQSLDKKFTSYIFCSVIEVTKYHTLLCAVVPKKSKYWTLGSTVVYLKKF